MHDFSLEVLLITLLGTVVISDFVSSKLKIPAIFLLLGSAYLLYTYVTFTVPIDLYPHFDAIVLFCIPMIFMADALHLKLSDLKRHAWSIFYLAVVAVAFSIAIGAALHTFGLFKGLGLGGYVALFAINMATDAVSVQSVLSRFEGIAHDIKILIEGESLGNDATAVVAFFFIGLPWMLSGSVDASGAAIEALRVFGLSIAAGLAIGYLCYLFLKLYDNKRSELFTFIIEAYGAYLIGEHFHISGILTLIVAIITTKAWIDGELEEREAQEQRKRSSFWRSLRLVSVVATTKERMAYIYEMSKEFGYIAATLIFFLLAESIDIEKLWHYRNEILTMFVATTLIRALSMAKFAFFGKSLEGIKPVGFNGWFLLTFSGMKGALSIILVHMIPDTFAYKEMFEAVTIGVVMLSIFVYGTILWAYFSFFERKEETKLFT